MLLLNIFSVVASCGCSKDGADMDGEAFFPIYFLRDFIMPLFSKTGRGKDYNTKNIQLDEWKFNKVSKGKSSKEFDI